MDLIIQYYRHPNAGRQLEIDRSLHNNILCKHITKIHLLLEEEIPLPCQSTKIIKSVINSRLTYAHAYEYANNNCSDVCILANADIWFDNSIAQLDEILSNEFIALTRYDINNGIPVFYRRRESQDAWLWSCRVPDCIINNSQFPLGINGCDNVTAFLWHEHGFQVANPSLSVKIYHEHETNIRHSGRGRINSPGIRNVTPTALKMYNL